jgi:hypothetical protein
MELEIDIKKMSPNANQLEDMDHHNPLMEIIERETFDEEESFVFQRSFFDSESTNLIIDKRYVKNKKGKSCS